MSNTKVINLTRVTQSIDVRHSDGKLDKVQIVSRGRVDLREGMSVDSRWLEKNNKTVNVIVPVKPVEHKEAAPQVVSVQTIAGE
jgi:hypothetical protein